MQFIFENCKVQNANVFNALTNNYVALVKCSIRLFQNVSNSASASSNGTSGVVFSVMSKAIRALISNLPPYIYLQNSNKDCK